MIAGKLMLSDAITSSQYNFTRMYHPIVHLAGVFGY